MIAQFVWLIFLVIIIAAVVKNGNRNRNRQSTADRKYTNTVPRQRTGKIPKAEPISQTEPAFQAKKERPQTSYSGPASDRRSSGSRKTAAARPVPKKEASAGASGERQMTMNEIYDKNNIVAAAKANAREVELDNDLDASQAKLMENVYDVMVKGPRDTISFQRDFLAEGLDMLNSFQSGNES